MTLEHGLPPQSKEYKKKNIKEKQKRGERNGGLKEDKLFFKRKNYKYDDTVFIDIVWSENLLQSIFEH